MSRSAMLASILTSLLVIGFLMYFFYPSKTMTQTQKSVSQVVIGATVIQVEVESTEAAREQGLSGRASLAEGSGMLFVFDTEGMHGFWMKDMSFAIDIIFADSSGRIITIAHNATPESYHEEPPRVFYPSASALYVLEVPAGFATAHAVEEGMTLQLK